MRVVYILPYDWGGMPHYTAEVANALANHVEVYVIGSKRINADYFSDKIHIIKAFNPLDFTMNHLKGALSAKTIQGFISYKAIREIDQIKPDIIHLTTPMMPPLPLYLKLYRLDKKYPIIYTKHNVHSQSDFLTYLLEEPVLNFFENRVRLERIIVHTLTDKDELCRTKGVPEKSIEVIPHGAYSIFSELSAGNIAERTGTDHTLLFFGNIREYKGLKYLLEAIVKVKDEISEIKLIVAGDGDITPYQGLIDACNGNVEVHNYYIPDEQVPAIFNRAAIVVLPYAEMSGMSGILNVAYAFNKPVIVTDVAGIHEMVEHEKTGLLIPPKDADQLASAIIRLLNEKEMRDEMKKNIERKCRDLSWDKIGVRTLELYNKVLNTSLPGA